MKWLLTAACATLILAQAVSGTVIHVPDDYPTIQAGINATSSGDTVLVGPGVYGESIFLAPDVYLTSEYGPAFTEITWSGHIITGANGSTIEGFRITNNGMGTSWGYGWSESSTVIRRNVFDGHYAGLHCGQTGSAETIVNNVITNNTHSGIAFGWDAAPTIKNNIIYDNGAGIHHYGTGYAPTIDYNDVWNNSTNYSSVTPGLNDISADPNFLNTAKRDWRLLWPSPCVDTGDPSLSFDDPDGTRNDMGTYYFNQNDYLNLYVTPDTTEVSPGDQLGVTYTAINRWDSPEACWLLSQVRRSGGSWLNLIGPDPYTLPANYTAQVHITHPVPNITPAGVYEYWSLIGMPPGTLYDEDSFKFTVIE